MKLLCVHCHAEGIDKVSILRLDLHPAMVELMEDMGILEVDGDMIRIEELLRAKKILHLRKSLGVNLTGATISAALLARIEDLQDDIERLRRG